MNYSYNWLKELTKTKKNAKDLAEMVGMRGFEFETQEEISERFADFVVGKILEIEPHPDADKLNVVQVQIGAREEVVPRGGKTKSEANSFDGRGATSRSADKKEDNILQIVCGAKNIKVGDLVPVALVGAIVPQNKFEIKTVKLRGVKSKGMLCAEDELGLGKDHAGIMILEEGKNIKIGEPLATAIGLNDTILEFDILPNRAHDCLSYEGLAREIIAMEEKTMKITERQLPTVANSKNNLQIKIENPELCQRYVGAVLENVKIKPSPQWLQSRLVASGMEPINNVVDITNLVMLEIGNPLHAFDYEAISEKEGTVKIIVRQAKEKEKMELLDGTQLELSKQDLVIANSEKVLALAGIKGGKQSGISEQTNRIVLESANFNGLSIRKSRQRHGLSTEAQARFEKKISSKLAEKATARAVELLEKYAEATLVEIKDENHYQEKERKVEMEFAYLNSLLGEIIEPIKAIAILERLGFDIVEKNDEKVTVKVPYWRLDVEFAEDLIEEVGRIIGYENIKSKTIQTKVDAPADNLSRRFEWQMREWLTGLGFDEMKNYSFYGQQDVDNCGLTVEHFEISNPLAPEHSLMRTTLLPNLLKNTNLNAKNFSEFKLFELSRVYEVADNNVPAEELRVSGVLYNENQKDTTQDNLFYSLKENIVGLFAKITTKEIIFKQIENEKTAIYHPAQVAEIKIGKEVIGKMGVVLSTTAKKYGIKKSVAVFELNFEKLRKLFIEKKTKNYQPFSKYPLVLRDLSMFVEQKTETAIIIEKIKKLAGKDLLGAELFDVYDDKENKRKSLAFHLSFGRDKETMKSEEVDKALEEIIEGLENDKIEVRTK